MSIVTMSKLKVIAPVSERHQLLTELARLGCVEINSYAARTGCEEWSDVSNVLMKHNETLKAEQSLSYLVAAMEILDKYAAVKTPFLSPRRLVSEHDFHNRCRIEEACKAADMINDLGRKLSVLAGEEHRLIAKQTSLSPWQDMDVPLDVKSGKHYRIFFGVSPAVGSSPQMLIDEAALKIACELRLISADREQNYYLLIVHTSLCEEVLEALKYKGFSLISFKDVGGTAADNIRQLDICLEDIYTERLNLIGNIKNLTSRKAEIEQAIDFLTIESKREHVLSDLACTKQTLYLEGWTPKANESEVAEILDCFGCAWQFEAPEEGEEAPILLNNNILITPFTMVTELYSLPAYSSGLDPNPFMAPFYFISFGLMMADIGYGLAMTLGAIYLLRRARPAEGSVMQRLTRLMMYCGISASIWGFFFGGFFGDSISAFSNNILGVDFGLKPILLDPLANPMALLILSLALGYIQIMLGLGLNAYKLIKQGHFMDAVYDVIFWMVFLLGVPVCLLNVSAGLCVMGAGALGVLLFAGRERKNIVRRLIGGLGSLYGATSYLSDILSYARLLALGLAGSVIAQVMNTIGALGGPSIIGAILFFFAFAIGHTFNIAISVLGAFVHSSRLQFIEFFGKFFDMGGYAFTPLYNKTKYVEIIKEVRKT